MADAKAVSIVPLSGTNYPTWNVQCRMALIREGLWGIVAGTEECPDSATDADKHSQVRRVESTRIRHVNPKGSSNSPMMPC